MSRRRIPLILPAGALLLCQVLAAAASPTTPHVIFEPAPQVARRAASEAAELVRFARAELGIRLDWTDASIHQIERLAVELGKDLRREGGKPSEVDKLVRLLGSYAGEVYRRNHGASWGEAYLGGQRRVALRPDSGGKLIWPVERIRRCLRQGGGGGLAAYDGRTLLAQP